MKTILSICMSLVFLTGVLAGCGVGNSTEQSEIVSDSQAPSSSPQQGEENQPEMSELSSSSEAESEESISDGDPVVYMTTDISSEGLIAIYEALEANPQGNIAVKLSTGESGSNYLRTDLIGDLVYEAEDGASLIQRMESRNGLHTLEHAEAIGLGSRTYELVNIDA